MADRKFNLNASFVAEIQCSRTIHYSEPHVIKHKQYRDNISNRKFVIECDVISYNVSASHRMMSAIVLCLCCHNKIGNSLVAIQGNPRCFFPCHNDTLLQRR